MATLTNNYLTLAEMASRTDIKGMPLQIAELINEDNSLTSDMVWKPSNEAFGHRSVVRTDLPTVYTRRLNQGTPPSRSSTANIRETLTMLESRSHIDAKELEVHANPGQLRMDEGRAFVEANIQKVTSLVFTGDPGNDPSEFRGLEERYASAAPGIPYRDNMIPCGGTGSDLSSIWVIRHGPGFHGLYPMNTLAGLRHEDLGKVQVPDVDGSTAVNHGSRMLSAYVDCWQWDCGIAVTDWRDVARVCNIESSDALGLTGTQALTTYATNIRYAMSDAVERIPTIGKGRTVIYMPRSLRIALKKMNKALTSANIFETEKVDGRPVLTFEGFEVKILDQLGYTETAVPVA